MAARLIALRYPGACSSCRAALSPGTNGWWDRDTRTVRCDGCGPLPEEAPRRVAPQRAPAPQGVAGGSAQREFERRKAKDEARVYSGHPHIGGLILALRGDRPSTESWAKGAEGERKLGAGLDGLAEAGVVAIHDRLRPGTQANIDHLAVAPSGVWVIDAKRYAGQVTKRDVGGWLRADLRLYVGRRDCTKLVTVMPKQVAAVRTALGPHWADVPVRPMLCFVDAQWRWFAKPFELDGVLVAWPRAARELLVRPGPYGRETVALIAATLGEQLKPAS